jgi:serine/threonine protein kinase
VVGAIARGQRELIYRMIDHHLGREVAYKVPRLERTGDPDVARRFVDEVRITAQLQHPGIPPVFDSGTLPGGCPFMIMKLVMGKTLDAVLKDEPDLTAERVRLLAAFEQVCRTVGYAHFRSIVHRNLEPANVMIGAFGEVQVLDWGLAIVVPKEGSGSVAVEDVRRGADLANPAYMAPEQARGEATDCRADVFGLGGLLCHLLTGGPPFAGDSVAAAARKAVTADLGDALSRLEMCRADTKLVTLAKECLRPRREERPSDASQVASRIVMARGT